MPKRFAEAEWKGALESGSGTVRFGDFEGRYSAGSRFEDEPGTNPEELIGAAHAGCFSMALSLVLGEEGYEAETIQTNAAVTIVQEGDEIAIRSIRLETEAHVPGLDQETFESLAQAAGEACPVSNALAGVENIEIEAHLR